MKSTRLSKRNRAKKAMKPPIIPMTKESLQQLVQESLEIASDHSVYFAFCQERQAFLEMIMSSQTEN